MYLVSYIYVLPQYIHLPETGLMVAFVAAHTAFLDRGIWSLLILDFGS